MNNNIKAHLYRLHPSGSGWITSGTGYVTITTQSTTPTANEGVGNNNDTSIYAQLGQPKLALSNFAKIASGGNWLLNVKLGLDRIYSVNGLELVWGEPTDDENIVCLKLEFETQSGINHILSQIKVIQDNAKAIKSSFEQAQKVAASFSNMESKRDCSSPPKKKSRWGVSVKPTTESVFDPNHHIPTKNCTDPSRYTNTFVSFSSVLTLPSRPELVREIHEVFMNYFQLSMHHPPIFDALRVDYSRGNGFITFCDDHIKKRDELVFQVKQLTNSTRTFTLKLFTPNNGGGSVPPNRRQHVPGAAGGLNGTGPAEGSNVPVAAGGLHDTVAAGGLHDTVAAGGLHDTVAAGGLNVTGAAEGTVAAEELNVTVAAEELNVTVAAEELNVTVVAEELNVTVAAEELNVTVDDHAVPTSLSTPPPTPNNNAPSTSPPTSSPELLSPKTQSHSQSDRPIDNVFLTPGRDIHTQQPISQLTNSYSRMNIDEDVDLTATNHVIVNSSGDSIRSAVVSIGDIGTVTYEGEDYDVMVVLENDQPMIKFMDGTILLFNADYRATFDIIEENTKRWMIANSWFSQLDRVEHIIGKIGFVKWKHFYWPITIVTPSYASMQKSLINRVHCRVKTWTNQDWVLVEFIYDEAVDIYLQNQVMLYDHNNKDSIPDIHDKSRESFDEAVKLMFPDVDPDSNDSVEPNEHTSHTSVGTIISDSTQGDIKRIDDLANMWGHRGWDNLESFTKNFLKTRAKMLTSDQLSIVIHVLQSKTNPDVIKSKRYIIVSNGTALKFAYVVGLLEDYISRYLQSRELSEVGDELANHEKVMTINMKADGIMMSTSGYPENVKAVKERGGNEYAWYKTCIDCTGSEWVILHRTHEKLDCNVFNYVIGLGQNNSLQKDGHPTCKCIRSICGKYKCLKRCKKSNCTKCRKEQESQLGYLKDDYMKYFNKEE
eukprot:scaffold10249_cov59-Cyclotella_meneghiniana.AAC.3